VADADFFNVLVLAGKSLSMAAEPPLASMAARLFANRQALDNLSKRDSV
jgi:hypothetical protein